LLCFLIPIVGPIVLLGYGIGVERALIENIAVDAPQFTFDKFGRYLSRGVQVFLANMVLTLILVPVMWILLALIIVPAILLAPNHPAVTIVCIVAGSLLAAVVAIVFGIAMVPLSLKAGLEDRFAAGFEFRFAWDFLRRVGWLALGNLLLLYLLVLPCLLLACIPIVGPYALGVVMTFVGIHLRIQFYLEYLNRGGTAIQIKYEPPEPGFPVMPWAPPPMPPQPPIAPQPPLL